MSLRVTYIGEDVAAAGFALAGVRVHRVPVDSQQVWSLLEAARSDSDLVVLNSDHANCVQEPLRALLLRYPVPPVLVLPPMGEEAPFSNVVVRRARSALGLATPGEQRSEGVST